MKTYRCKSGHEYSDVSPWELRLKYAADAVVSSGPLCPYCYQEFLRTSFGADEVEHQVKTQAVTVPFWPSEPEKPKRPRRHTTTPSKPATRPIRVRRKKEAKHDET